MKIASLGDIHGNNYALVACLEKAENEKADYLLILGDFITDCPNARETLDLIYQAKSAFKTIIIKGNREEYMLDYRNGKKNGWKQGSKYGSLLFSYNQLEEKDFSFFESLPISEKITLEGIPNFEICHGSLKESRCMAVPGRKELDDLFLDMQTEFLFCAHTHRQFYQEKNGKIIVNCGAAGLPHNSERCAEMLITEYKSGEWKTNLLKVAYDVDSLVRDFKTSGFIDFANVWARAMLACIKNGKNYARECLLYVENESKERSLLDDESLFEEAAKLLGI